MVPERMAAESVLWESAGEVVELVQKVGKVVIRSLVVKGIDAGLVSRGSEMLVV